MVNVIGTQVPLETGPGAVMAPVDLTVVCSGVAVPAVTVVIVSVVVEIVTVRVIVPKGAVSGAVMVEAELAPEL